jgi:hypothetical protein
MKYSYVLSLISLIFISCSKNKENESDKVFPVVTINSPVNGQSFTAGQLIPISGTITDNEYIAEVHIHVSNNNTGALLMDVHIYPGTDSTTFTESITAANGVNYKIQVIAKDRAVNESRSVVEVTCN